MECRLNLDDAFKESRDYAFTVLVERRLDPLELLRRRLVDLVLRCRAVSRVLQNRKESVNSEFRRSSCC